MKKSRIYTSSSALSESKACVPVCQSISAGRLADLSSKISGSTHDKSGLDYVQKSFFSMLLVITITACSADEKADAYGNFEADEVTVSAKGIGQLKSFQPEEGDQLSAGQLVGYIDTTNLYLDKLQLQANLEAIDDRLKDATPDIQILKERKRNLIRERDRTKTLVDKKAATRKQLDDYNGEIDVIDQQIKSTQNSVAIANRGLLSERKPLRAQIDVINNRIKDQLIVNPISGTILDALVEESEFVSQGTPLYRVANLEKLRLKAYTSATLLANISLGKKVIVRVDDGNETLRNYEGVVKWIASDAEFTPKTIETKEERVNLVYALEIEVENDGKLKLGMPGEVVFNQDRTQD